MNVTSQNGQVVFDHVGSRLTVTLHRTLRLPEDGRTHALPPSLGMFPIRKIEDYRAKVPVAWREHGGVFLPMWQREALWLSFHSLHERPFAVQVAAGKVNAVSGEPWEERLQASGFGLQGSGAGARGPKPEVQNYLVTPPQPWLDGFNTGQGKIRQFVAMPLGMGYTVEAQVTGKEDVGGVQLLVAPPRAGRIPFPPPSSMPRPITKHSLHAGFGAKLGGQHHGLSPEYTLDSFVVSASGGAASFSASNTGSEGFSIDQHRQVGSDRPRASRAKGAEMGLGQGGEMEQKIYPDPYGVDVWDVEGRGRLFLHIVNSELWREITGEAPPPSPVSAQTYAHYGYPWFKLWDAEMGDVAPSGVLAGVKTVGQKDQSHGFSGPQDDTPVHEKTVSAGTVKPGSLVEGKEWAG